MTNYPQASYELWLGTPTGERLALLDGFSTFAYARKQNTIGRWSVSIAADKVPEEFVKADAMIEAWRTIPGAPASLLCVGLTRIIDYMDRGGSDTLTLLGDDGLGLLRRRRVAYKADSAQASKSDYADDMIKAIVRENLGASVTDTDRDLTAYGITVETDLALAPTVDMKFAWKSVFAALRAIASASRTEGTNLYFDMVPKVVSATSIGWEFRTYIDRRGANRTYDLGVPTIFGREWGNLEAPHLTFDYSHEATYIYAGGPGEGPDREVNEQSDATRLARSVWNRNEAFIQASNSDLAAALTDAAKGALDAGRPELTLTGRLKDTPQTRYGIDWEYGDEVVIVHRDREYRALIDATEIMVSPDGKETIAAQVEVSQ